MDSVITQIEMDTSGFLSEEGFGVCVYMGEGSCDPIVETTYDFESLIENHFESFVINDRIREVDAADAELLVTKLEQMAKYARNMLEDYTLAEEE
jgi:hypothetical protein